MSVRPLRAFRDAERVAFAGDVGYFRARAFGAGLDDGFNDGRPWWDFVGSCADTSSPNGLLKEYDRGLALGLFLGWVTP
jgi:hypothetical protein